MEGDANLTVFVNSSYIDLGEYLGIQYVQLHHYTVLVTAMVGLMFLYIHAMMHALHVNQIGDN